MSTSLLTSKNFFNRNYVEESGKIAAHIDSYSLSSAFQPIYKNQDGKVMLFGFEALGRVHQQGNAKNILTFLDSLSPIERCHIERTLLLLHVQNYIKFCPGDFKLFLNFDPRCLISENEVIKEDIRQLNDMINTAGHSQQNFYFEIMEKAAICEDSLIDAVQTLKVMGYKIAIDDFGREHSNIERVISMKPDIVKLDRSWLSLNQRYISSHKNLQMITDQIKNMGIKVLLEGVENRNDALIADDIAADFVQGYYYGKPQPLPTSFPVQGMLV